MSRLYMDSNGIQQAAIYKQPPEGNYPPRGNSNIVKESPAIQKICTDEHELYLHIKDFIKDCLPPKSPLLENMEELAKEIFLEVRLSKNLTECNRRMHEMLMKKQEGVV